MKLHDGMVDDLYANLAACFFIKLVCTASWSSSNRFISIRKAHSNLDKIESLNHPLFVAQRLQDGIERKILIRELRVLNGFVVCSDVAESELELFIE